MHITNIISRQLLLHLALYGSAYEAGIRVSSADCRLDGTCWIALPGLFSTFPFISVDCRCLYEQPSKHWGFLSSSSFSSSWSIWYFNLLAARSSFPLDGIDLPSGNAKHEVGKGWMCWAARDAGQWLLMLQWRVILSSPLAPICLLLLSFAKCECLFLPTAALMAISFHVSLDQTSAKKDNRLAESEQEGIRKENGSTKIE